MKVAVIIPTYNGRENIQKLIPHLFRLPVTGLEVWSWMIIRLMAIGWIGALFIFGDKSIPFFYKPFKIRWLKGKTQSFWNKDEEESV